jgi:HEAT repeat protein
LAAIRWFAERPGDAKAYIKAVAAALEDPDEIVRLESIRAISLVDRVDDALARKVSSLLADPCAGVRKEAAKACGKFGCRSKEIISALRQAAEDKQIEVRWKAQKALRKLGAYEIS